jgi:vesicle-fusing ATPase
MTTVTEPREQTYAERQVVALATEIAQVRAQLEAYRDGAVAPGPAAEPAGGATALADVAAAFGLSAFERRLLLLAAAVELDGETAALAAAVQGGSDPRPTFVLAYAALPGAHWDALAPSSPLRRWRLLELGAGHTLATRPLRLDERVLHHLTGIPALDERLRGIVAVAAPAPRAPSHERLAAGLGRVVLAAGAPCAVRLDGDDCDGRMAVAGELARALERVPITVRASALAPAADALADQALLIDREAALLGALPIVDAEDAPAALVAALLGMLQSPAVVVVGAYAGRTDGRVAIARTVAVPEPSERRALWSRALGAAPDADVAAAVEGVAQHYRLGAAAVDAIARELRATPDAGGDVAGTLRRLCRERTRACMDDLAERIDARATWDDLVLPDGHVDLLHEIARHVRHRTQVYERWGFGERTSRGLGVTALFAGESGTGKTLAAEVLAHELDLDLYRIDLSATVSKYIGETEKNLRRLFDAAESSGAVLLFDEADALFGKRGEVKDGHDRYANLEVAYLLQRMESYRGLAVLTTNLRSNVDRAFLRRLRFVVQFPFPGVAERAAIWRRAFPAAAPLDGIDPEQLAELTVSGGSIRSIALGAAFSAAHDGVPIAPEHVLRAARLDFAKAERAHPDWKAAGLA